MSEPATPAQVIRALAADWRHMKISYSVVAEKTGYKYQTIANFISNKKTYFSFTQAQKLSHAFGYPINYLMYGEGELTSTSDKTRPAPVWNQLATDGLKLEYVMDAMKTVATHSDDGKVKDLYNLYLQAFTTDDRDVFVANLANASDVLKEWDKTVEEASATVKE